MARLFYRVRQFWNTVTANPSQELLDETAEVLSPQLLQLFQRMQPAEQKHSLNVYKKLCTAGETNRDLLIAALLHDVGKIKFPLHVWERVEIVLLKKLAPGKAAAWGTLQPVGWRKPFAVALKHPDWGADLAEQAGASPLTVSLIRRHQEKDELDSAAIANDPEKRLLRQLQIYDNES